MSHDSDNLDKASELQDVMNASGLANARRAMQPQQHALFDGKHCLDCDEDMLEARLAAGRIRCTECETKKERNFR